MDVWVFIGICVAWICLCQILWGVYQSTAAAAKLIKPFISDVCYILQRHQTVAIDSWSSLLLLYVLDSVADTLLLLSVESQLLFQGRTRAKKRVRRSYMSVDSESIAIWTLFQLCFYYMLCFSKQRSKLVSSSPSMRLRPRRSDLGC